VRPLAKPLAVGVGISVVAAVLAATLATDGSLKSWLYVLGGCCELVGIAFVAAPELAPRLKDVREWTTRKAEQAAARAKRLLDHLRTPARNITVAGISDAGLAVGGHLKAERIQGFPPEATTVDARLAFLLTRVTQLQAGVDDIGSKTEQVRTDFRNELDEVRKEIRQVARLLVEESDVRFLDWRYAGLTLVAVGIVLGTFGNLVS
jgi:hypothetical protein